MTGNGVPGSASGVHTLTVRQSSSERVSVVVPPAVICGRTFAGMVASRGVVHAVTGCGGFQRFAPVGGAAYGIPRKARAVRTLVPRTTPFGVVTSKVCAPPEPGAPPDDAPPAEAPPEV